MTTTVGDLIGLPGGDTNGTHTFFLQRYLARYGYYATENPETVIAAERGRFGGEATQSALRRFHEFNGFAFDASVVAPGAAALVGQPRCAVMESFLRAPDDKGWVRIWNRKELSYGIIGDTPSSLGAETQRIVAEAFAKWSGAIGFSFDSAQSAIDIAIKFKGSIPGYTDAYGYGNYPPNNKQQATGDPGDIWLASATTWSEEYSNDKISLAIVMLHEIGHALGLTHTAAGVRSIMCAYYPHCTTGAGELFEHEVGLIKEIYSKIQEHPR